MNNGDRKMIIRLEERFKNMHEDIREIKDSVKNIKGCIHNSEMSILELDTTLYNHLKNHSSKIKISKKNAAVICAIAALASIVIGVLRLMG